MNIPRRIVSPLLAVAVAAGLLTGCTPEPQPQGFAYVVGDRANSAPIDPAGLAALLPGDLPVGSVVSVTGVDGDAGATAGLIWTFADLGDSYSNADELLGFRAALGREHLLAVAAESAEADVLSAVSVAADTLAAVDGPKTLVISDSLLSTQGLLDFDASPLLAATGDVVADQISDEDLPDLTGYDIVIVGVGDTAAPQPDLPERDKVALRDIWSAVLLKAGAAEVTFDAVGGGTAIEREHPPVSNVAASDVQGAIWADPCTAVVPESQIRFIHDSSVFISELAAREALSIVAEGMRACEGRLQVAGTTTSAGTVESRRAVALGRAEAGRRVLAELLQVPVETIEVCALGHVGGPDRRPDGALDEALAAANRTLVVSVDASCPATV